MDTVLWICIRDGYTVYFKTIWDKGSTVWNCICKTMLFAVVFPVFITDEVNVIVSPIVAKVVLAFLFKTKVASIIGVAVVFVTVLPTAGVWFGFTVYS